MQLHGFPKTFWLVVSPSPVSMLTDICFKCDLRRFALQIRGGLDEQNIIAVFTEQQPAEELAKRMLRVIQESRKTPNERIHKSPWPDWYATQESTKAVVICNRETAEETLIEPPKEWGTNWAWNFTEDGSGVVLHQTA